MRLWISLYLPNLVLNLLCPDHQSRSVVVVDQQRVLQCSALALSAGIQIGDSWAEAQARCPEVEPLAHQAHLEEEALKTVATALMQYTPEISLLNNNSVVLDVTASLRLFKGARALYKNIATTVAQMGFEARIAQAPSGLGAWLLASAAVRLRRCLQTTTLQRRLDYLPCSHLPALTPYLNWLDRIGCQRLKTLRQLPRSGLARRTHPDVLKQLDQAYGRQPEHYAWFQAPANFSQQISLPEPLTHTNALGFFATRLIQQLAAWLSQRHLACTKLLFTLKHSNSRKPFLNTQFSLSFSAAVRHANDMLEVLHAKLATLTLPAPVNALALSVTHTQLPDAPPSSLFPEPGDNPNEQQAIIDQLIARLGSGQVLQAAPKNDYRPEISNQWVPYTPAKALSFNAMTSQPWGPRPLWLLKQPLPLNTQRHRPYYQAELRLLYGPERIEDGWWDTPVLRDYFVAQAPDGTLYWLFQNRGQDNAWFLHGIFA